MIEPVEIVGQEWDGFYSYDNQSFPMNFERLDISNGQFSAVGHDTVGDFTMNGQVIEGTFNIIKQYIGQHQVNYNGQMDLRHRNSIEGNWIVQTDQYSFSDGFKLFLKNSQ
eukprot:403370063